MIAYLQYKRVERINDTTILEYRYYKLDNGEWLVQSEQKWNMDKDSDRYKELFSKIITFPFPVDTTKYNYDIRDIFSKIESVKDIKSEPIFPVYLTYKCKWSGQYMTDRIA